MGACFVELDLPRREAESNLQISGGLARGNRVGLPNAERGALAFREIFGYGRRAR